MGLDTQVLRRHLARRVGGDGGERRLFGHRQLILDDRPVHLGRTREEHPGQRRTGPGRLEDMERADGVHLQDVLGIDPRVTHVGQGRQVVDGVG